MISFIKTIQTYNAEYVEGFCLTADVSELPTAGIANGSKMEVLDTNTITEYRFDEENGEWVSISTGGGADPTT